MRTYLPLLLILFLGFTACHRDKTPAPKQYSTWIVNNHDTFKTNNVDSSIDCTPIHTDCDAVIMSKDPNNWFSLAFASDRFPTSGNYQLYTPPQLGIVPFAIKLYYNNRYYYHTPSRIDTVYASVANNKPRYTMPPNWFVSYDNPTGDSILIEGVFNVP